MKQPERILSGVAVALPAMADYETPPETRRSATNSTTTGTPGAAQPSDSVTGADCPECPETVSP